MPHLAVVGLASFIVSFCAGIMVLSLLAAVLRAAAGTGNEAKRQAAAAAAASAASNLTLLAEPSIAIPVPDNTPFYMRYPFFGMLLTPAVCITMVFFMFVWRIVRNGGRLWSKEAQLQRAAQAARTKRRVG